MLAQDLVKMDSKTKNKIKQMDLAYSLNDKYSKSCVDTNFVIDTDKRKKYTDNPEFTE